MARKLLTNLEKSQIKNSIIETRKRRKSQIVKVIEVKVDCHHTSKKTFDLLHNYFKQAKWVINDMIANSNNNIFDYNYLEHKQVSRKDKTRNIINENITLPVYYHRALIVQNKTNISNLAKAKNKGNKVGKLRFKKEVNCIPIISGGVKLKDNKHITIPGFKNLCVYGLNQLDKYKSYELADGKLIRKASGFYIHISICVDKNEFKTEKKNKEVGLDFGIKTSITTSDGDKFNVVVRESEQLKFLQKQLKKKIVGSKRYWHLINQIRREYEHLSNKRTDVSNKLISFLLKNYDTIYFQDENISGWKRKKKSKTNKNVYGLSFGNKIQSNILGRVKSKLVQLESSGKSYKISKFAPTTKFCPNCGTLNKLQLSDRTYKCNCGYSEDRDVHAAKNVKLFGSTKRAECLEQASAETMSSALFEKLKEGKICL